MVGESVFTQARAEANAGNGGHGGNGGGGSIGTLLNGAGGPGGGIVIAGSCTLIQTHVDIGACEFGTVPAPTVTSVAATAITTISAMLNGTVNPANGATTAYFLIRPHHQLWRRQCDQRARGEQLHGCCRQPHQRVVAGTMYHYRLVGNNSGGTSLGNDLTFTTSAAAPVVTTAAATAITAPPPCSTAPSIQGMPVVRKFRGKLSYPPHYCPK